MVLCLLFAAGTAHAQDDSSIQLDPIPGWFDQVSRNSRSTAWGDLDNDGDLDLVFGTLEQGVRIIENRGGQLADSAIILRSDSAGEHLRLADMNSDGRLDIILGNFNLYEFTAQENQILLNLSEPGRGIYFSPEPSWTAPIADNTTGMAVGDLDGDALPELIVADDFGITIYDNHTEDGQLELDSRMVLDLSDQGFVQAIELADIGQDGNLEITVAIQTFDNDLSVLIYEEVGGALQFSQQLYMLEPPMAEVPSLPGTEGYVDDGLGVVSDMAWGDFTGDGYPEIAVVTNNGHYQVFANNLGEMDATPYWTPKPYSGEQGIKPKRFPLPGVTQTAMAIWILPSACAVTPAEI